MARRGRESLGLGARLRRSAPQVHHPLAEGRGELTSFSDLFSCLRHWKNIQSREEKELNGQAFTPHTVWQHHREG